MVCLLIFIGKMPGCRPICIDVFRRIKGKAVMMEVNDDVREAVGTSWCVRVIR